MLVFMEMIFESALPFD